jgi:pristinamycin I synthase-3/4
MLGVLKAGGAYVPLDADYPAARRAYICEEAALGLLLTQKCFQHLWSDFAGAVVCLDRDKGLLADEADTDPPVNASPDNLAYLVHTSGSTGRPKGVLATHRGAVNYLKYIDEEFPLSDRDVVLQLAAPTFDASVRDIFGTLNAGAMLLLVSQTESREPSALLSRIRERGVTALLSVVPTMLGALLDAAGGAVRGSLGSVRLILSSGEPLPATYCRRAREVFGKGVLVVNQYGPTECAMTSSFQHVAALPSDSRTIPIGRPIRNRWLYLLDKHFNLTPFGVAGEVYIGGPGIARGYLNRPDLTAQSFVPDPFGGEPGARLYRTGDLARHLPDGQLEFLGRLDHQMKLRGLRIEPAEIEAALSEHRAVKTAVVVMREDEPGDRRLVAYVVPSKALATRSAPPPTDDLLTVSGLREHLRERLPEYMLPAAFVLLETLPLTPTGKIDRRALPAPEQVRPELSQLYVAPRTPVEAELAVVWAEVLDIERAGIHDDFFELGGHSLLAIQLASRISEAFHLNLPMARLFEAPTIAQLALLVTQAQAVEEDEGQLAQILAELKGQGEDVLINED